MNCEAIDCSLEAYSTIIERAEADEYVIYEIVSMYEKAAVIAAGHQNTPGFKEEARCGTNTVFRETQSEIRAEFEVEIIYGDIIGPRGLISG